MDFVEKCKDIIAIIIKCINLYFASITPLTVWEIRTILLFSEINNHWHLSYLKICKEDSKEVCTLATKSDAYLNL